ncbi:Piso0_005065 [Millerozyma farinosa CBS 7064]|uniref:Large ribosomal subunit protein mL44 n=1 Tax=Pichia sorbitophila (strain ATCC MYA-4447 / BCRC 22081 / CBS 7064 / NBRC 10061 / NRRL Y-12695) TaxID=559304 RepID=G8Y451_PICSO|nr:Piso0_005065 [Millerozyma farinosa CBS 7064]
MLQPMKEIRAIGSICSRITPACFYHVSRPDVSLKTTYDSIKDYGSYKNNIFTHRLPESTAEQSPLLVALHSRLNLPKSYSLSTLSQALNLIKFEGLANNFGLNTLGKTLLSYYVSESLLIRYPRLPMPVHNLAIDAYMGVNTLYDTGKSWGIEVDTTTKLEKHLSQEPEFMRYGKLRFLDEPSKKTESKEPGVFELSAEELSSVKNDNTYLSREAEAYASSVRSIIGGLYTHEGEEATKSFIHNHILSRKLPLDQMFQFSKPTRELVRLAEKLQFSEPVEIRLIAETGRLSSHAMYVAGAFCGTDKLGEGIGSSLQEAKTRAVVNALMSYYLYSPVSQDGSPVKLPSDNDYKFEGIVGGGDVAI